MRLSILVASAVLAAACGGDGDDSSATTTTIPPPCDELFGEGETLRADAFEIPCLTEDGTQTSFGGSFLDCTNGRKLMWNSLGWGYTGMPWHTDATTPPDDERTNCIGTP